jgi:hypothetical protein
MRGAMFYTNTALAKLRDKSTPIIHKTWGKAIGRRKKGSEVATSISNYKEGHRSFWSFRFVKQEKQLMCFTTKKHILSSAPGLLLDVAKHEQRIQKGYTPFVAVAGDSLFPKQKR